MIYLVAAVVFAIGMVLAAVFVISVIITWLSSESMEARYRRWWQSLVKRDNGS